MEDLTPSHWNGPKEPECEHKYEATPFKVDKFTIIYRCRICGDEYEKDVS